MIPLYEDQIHAPAFQKISDFIWSDDATRENKSGNWDYVVSVVKEHNPKLKIVNHKNLPAKGIIFVGMCHLLESIFRMMPKTGSYIVIHRTNDRPFTKEMYEAKPPSVKHIYTVDCQVNAPDVTAIPFGFASINGEDNLIKTIAQEQIEPAATKLFCRYNVNESTPHRNESLEILRNKPFAKVIEKQIPGDEFYRNVKAHPFTMALAGCGADASRQWTSVALGSIPIVSDCVEMRHFEDLPFIFCPANMNEITEEWLDTQIIQGKSTERMRMSYWEKEINKRKMDL